MILLDTNVLSEFMRVAPEPTVVAWLDDQPTDRVWICAINRAEIELGIALLPEGRKKQDLKLKAETMLDCDFAGRCLPFDHAAASQYARIIAARTRIGKPITVEDAQIAAIALAHRLTLATRNVADFRKIETLDVIDPWQGQ
ncbi:type II toxin-antitoxin system VapC family toxin [Halochromatium glycolicum]|uniref:Ribonuclease VapC n=1 Tax=Halochromatium glycolicum TaxID=85075 RepID=A0AAJ0XBA9_9GAMM|nr:type II toxin-antitoxin system VapC family toxin [Halochromatium glycolicum]MBK1706669.1 VapC toxin family PIN domain ribonuclease [Halochromatium glycolicum]